MKILIFLLIIIPYIASGGCSMQEPADEFSPEESLNNENYIISSESEIPAVTSKHSQEKIPVLMYHHLTKNPQLGGDLCPEEFKKQLEFLYEQGYRTVDADYLSGFIRGDKQPEQPKVMITFDDGYESFYDKAVPLLKSYDFEATLFIYTERIKDREGHLSSADLQNLASEGFSIQSHSVTHTSLVEYLHEYPGEKAEQKITGELEESKKQLEGITGEPVNHFAFPFGDYNRELLYFAREADYDLLFIADERHTEYPFVIPRIPVQKDMDMEIFRNIFR